MEEGHCRAARRWLHSYIQRRESLIPLLVLLADPLPRTRSHCIPFISRRDLARTSTSSTSPSSAVPTASSSIAIPFPPPPPPVTSSARPPHPPPTSTTTLRPPQAVLERPRNLCTSACPRRSSPRRGSSCHAASLDQKSSLRVCSGLARCRRRRGTTRTTRRTREGTRRETRRVASIAVSPSRSRRVEG